MNRKKQAFGYDDYKRVTDEIELNLIYSLQIDVNHDICQDSNGVIYLDNKPIRYPKSINTDFGVIEFDPFNNKKLGQFLVQRFLKIFSVEHPDINVVSFFIANLAYGDQRIIGVCRTSKSDYISNPFYNESVCWVDLIMKMDDQQEDYNIMSNVDQYINFMREMEGKV